MTLLRIEKSSRAVDPLLGWISGAREVLKEDTFRRTIAVERKRTERSRKPFLLMLLEVANPNGPEESERVLDRMMSALLLSTRETDVIGWYKDRTTVGLIFTDLVVNDKSSILSVILGKVSTTLRDELTPEQFTQVSMSFHFFPDHWDQGQSGHPSNPALYPEIGRASCRERV